MQRHARIGRLLACSLVWLVVQPVMAAPPPPRAKAAKPHASAPKSPKPKAKSRPAKNHHEDTAEDQPTAFAEAFEEGKTALDQVQASAVGIKVAEEQKDEETIAKLKKSQAKASVTALENFQRALFLAGKARDKEQPNAEDLAAARYYLCYLYYDSGSYYEAAVLGNFLAHHHADSAEGRQGAKIALAAFIQLYGDSKQSDKSFETEKIQDIAQYIVEKWPNEPEAEEAAQTLLNFAIQQRDLDKALAHLKKIPEESPRRGQAELRAGQAFWATYLKAMQTPAEERPADSELDRFKDEARQSLESGISRLRKQSEPNPAIVGAMLSLAQIYLDLNEADKALATLDDEKFGPLKLINAKNAATARDSFIIETYKVALRAYVAKEQVDKAKTVMDALDQAVSKSGDAKSGEMLTQIYIGLGRELQQQLDRLRKGGRKKELESVSKAFETFLAHIGSRKEGNNFSSLNWVGETCYALATTADDHADPPNEKAARNYTNAAKAYEQILRRATEDAKSAPNPDLLMGIRLRLAACQRRLGNYEDAIKLVQEVLKEKPSNLTAQIEGAEIYQAQGATQRDGYLKAISGGDPKKRNSLIWGWGKIAKLTQDNPKYAATFHQARLNLAASRYFYALQVKETDNRDKTLDAAKRDLWLTYRLYPTLGGAESYARYDRLLRQIQEQLHQPPVGMQEFKEREANEAAESASKNGGKGAG